MNTDLTRAISLCLGASMTFFGVAAAFISLLEALMEDDQQHISAWFRRKWIAIGSSGWLSMPERVIGWSLRSLDDVSKSILELMESRFLGSVSLTSVPLLLILGCFIHLGVGFGIAALVIYLPIILVSIPSVASRLASAVARAHRNSSESVRFLSHDVILDGRKIGVATDIYLGQADSPSPSLMRHAEQLIGLWGLLAIGGAAVAAVLWLLIVLKMEILWAALTMAILSPFYWFLISQPVGVIVALIGWLLKRDEFDAEAARAPVFTFSAATAFSFSVTLLAMWIGHYIRPGDDIPNSLQLLFSNAIFDGLTVVATIALLRRATMGRPALMAIPRAILLCILVSSMSAYGSLYFGLNNSRLAFSVMELTNTFLGHSRDGGSLDLGPYFWVMHSTFMPTLAYLVVVLFCWIAKVFLHPVWWIFGREQEVKNPLRLAAALCGFVSALFGAMYFVLTAL